MKTPQEFLDSCQLAPGIWNGDVKSLIEQRDAEHRAELLKVQDDLLQAANREVMTAALIERLRGELAEAARKATLALGLAKDINAAYGCACDFDGEQCDCGGDGTGPAGSDGCWSCQARDVLAAPPPAESTPVQRIVMKETSWGGRYAVTQGEPLAVPADCGRCLDRARCIRNDRCADWGEGAGEDASPKGAKCAGEGCGRYRMWHLGEQYERDGGMALVVQHSFVEPAPQPAPSGYEAKVMAEAFLARHEKRLDDVESNVRDVRAALTKTACRIDGRIDDHERRLAALEAKGETPQCYSIDCRYYGQRHATPHEPQEDQTKGAKP